MKKREAMELFNQNQKYKKDQITKLETEISEISFLKQERESEKIILKQKILQKVGVLNIVNRIILKSQIKKINNDIKEDNERLFWKNRHIKEYKEEIEEEEKLAESGVYTVPRPFFSFGQEFPRARSGDF